MRRSSHERLREYFRSTDEPGTVRGIQDRAMQVRDISIALRNSTHIELFGRFDHDLKPPPGKCPGPHSALGRDLDGARRMDEQIVFVERASIGYTMRQSLKRGADGHRKVLGGGRCAQHPQLAQGVVSATHAIDESGPGDAFEKVGGSRFRLA